MSNPDEVLKKLFEEECRTRSEDPQLDLRIRAPGNPVWRPVGAVAAAALLLSAFTLGMQHRQPSDMDRLIADSLPSAETWNRMLTAGSEFVIGALEGADVR